MRYWLIIPAAGLGQRLGAGLPKQYLEVAGRCLLEWALAPFLADPRCMGVVLSLAADDRWWPGLRARLSRGVLEARGGAERSDSVRQALELLAGRVADDPWVLVHDAARPCVSRQEIDALLGAVADHPDGGLLALPLADTLKRADAVAGNPPVVARTESRKGLWRALTPQAFRLRPLLAALQAAAQAGRVPTDEAEAIEWAGLGRPLLVAGSASNLKVTTPADLALVTRLLTTCDGPAVGDGSVACDGPAAGGGASRTVAQG
ncbi:MAG: 2-C-methyl-D-erythritol 4-phosphate cytidylyltransferase [Steroidobacteraceae bacterium]